MYNDTTFEVPSFTNSKDMIKAKFTTNRSRDPDHAHFVVVKLTLDMYLNLLHLYLAPPLGVTPL